MENWCYFCKQEGKDVIARVVWQTRPCCAAHRMKFVADGQTDTPKTRVPDGPVLPPSETIPSEPVISDSHTLKVRTPGRLERASMTAPVVDAGPAKKYRGRKPGSKNKPKTPPAETQKPSAQRQVNLALRTAVDRRAPQPQPLDLTRLYEIHAELIARRARIDQILSHLEGAIQVLGNESDI